MRPFALRTSLSSALRPITRRIVMSGSRDLPDRPTRIHFTMSPRVTVGRHCMWHRNGGAWVVEYGPDVQTRIRLGDFVGLAQDVEFLATANHRIDWVSGAQFDGLLHLQHGEGGGWLSQMGDIEVGNDVLISHAARILPGVTVGDG